MGTNWKHVASEFIYTNSPFYGANADTFLPYFTTNSLLFWRFCKQNRDEGEGHGGVPDGGTECT